MREIEIKFKLKVVNESEWKHPANQAINRTICYCPKLQPDDFDMAIHYTDVVYLLCGKSKLPNKHLLEHCVKQ